MIKINTKILLIGAVVVVALVGGALLLSNRTNTASNQSTENSPTVNQSQNPVQEKVAQVTVTANGFEPSNLKIKAGTKVVWTNKSGAMANVSSDIHPTHLLWPFLNLGSFADGEMVSVVFEKSGAYTYHNHLNPSSAGTVTVE